MKIKQVIMPAGGRGERLKPLTDILPKPLIPVCSKPFIDYLLGFLSKNGIEEVVLLTGYLAEKLENYVGDCSKYNLKVRCIRGPAEWETGARIRSARDFADDIFFMMYSDNYLQVKLEDIENFYNKYKTLGFLTMYDNHDKITKNNVLVKDDFVLQYDKSRTAPNLNAVDIGATILKKEVFDLMPEGNYNFEAVMYPKLVEIKQLVGYVTDKRHYNIDNMEKLKTFEAFVKEKGL
jgi:NDP-sugar pyrophosphorylase family protein